MIAVGAAVVPYMISRGHGPFGTGWKACPTPHGQAADGLRFCNVVATVYGDSAAAALTRGDNEAAKRAAISALAVTPKNVRARYMLGVALFRLSDRNGARREWERCLADEPGYKPALRAISQLGWGLGS